MEANGVRVLTLLLSIITFEMFFKESDISCTIEHFFLGFLQIPLKRWTPLAKPFPLIHFGKPLFLKVDALEHAYICTTSS